MLGIRRHRHILVTKRNYLSLNLEVHKLVSLLCADRLGKCLLIITTT
jgi:hypothetical protein